MTFYSLLLFAHIASAFFLFAGLAVESTLISFLRRNPDLARFPPGAAFSQSRLGSTVHPSASFYSPAVISAPK